MIPKTGRTLSPFQRETTGGRQRAGDHLATPAKPTPLLGPIGDRPQGRFGWIVLHATAWLICLSLLPLLLIMSGSVTLIEWIWTASQADKRGREEEADAL
jgi:hypothetical protein